MKLPLTLAAALLGAMPVLADDAATPAPAEFVAAVPAGDWMAIAPEDLLVIDLVPDSRGRDLPPDTSSGAGHYAGIDHAPRQLDRNIPVPVRRVK